MPPKRQTPKVGQKHEMEAFAERYDTLALVYGDPVEIVFAIMARNAKPVLNAEGIPCVNDPVALQAANLLMTYRYPRVKAADGQAAQAPVLNFNVTMAPPKELEVNVRPPRAIVAITEGKK